MLQHIDSALESFLRTSIGLDARDVDVAFDPPDREWGGSLNRPTLNLFLWSINRNTDRDLAGQRAAQVDGRTVYANAPVPIELRYLVTAWSADLKGVAPHAAGPPSFRKAAAKRRSD